MKLYLIEDLSAANLGLEPSVRNMLGALIHDQCAKPIRTPSTCDVSGTSPNGDLDSSIGPRAHRRLRENKSYKDLLLLSECNRGGRVPGAVTTELEEVIDHLRSLGDES
ncbi:MAG: hypothetical protein NTY15_01975 [Planctomycetota bacterium]|nr:hypothetical protein [Planctomycetota bacterium]